MEKDNIQAPSDTGADSPPARQAVPRHRWPPPLATLGLFSSVAGLIVEVAWWKGFGYEWQGVYRFLSSGAPFWWSFGLSLLGGAATWRYWCSTGRSRWWGVPGVVVASMWAVRMVIGLIAPRVE